MKRLALSLLMILWLLVTPALAAEHKNIGVCLDYLSAEEACSKECSLGNYAADAIRYALGTDVAVIPGRMLSSSLNYGSVTADDIAALFPTNDTLVVVSISPQTLKALLEKSVMGTVLTFEETIDTRRSASDWFLQVSGFRFVYNPEAKEGSRLMNVTLDERGEIDLSNEESILSLGIPLSALPVFFDTKNIQYSKSEITLLDAFSSHLHDNGTQPERLNRIRAAGTAENRIISYIPRSLLWMSLVMFTLIGIIRPRFVKENYTEHRVKKSKVFDRDYFYM